MATDRDSRIDGICVAALALDGPSRDAFVAAACAGDEALHREIDSLLRYQSKADGFLAEPALAVAAERLASAGDALLGRQLGAFRVHSLLGEGGMGEVYRARDTTLGRDVALKVLPALFMADPDRLARFEREARTLATLNHPHIGAIYGLEEHDGIRVLVLEIVEGSTLADRIALGALSIAEGAVHRADRSPTRSKRRTRRGSSIGISSRPTSRSRPTASSRCWTSAWRRSGTASQARRIRRNPPV